MCGLAGEVRLDGRAADIEAVARMSATMCDRGPDGGGTYALGAVAFGHRRLKIIDLSEAGSQPMVDSHLGLSAIFNGIIYNYKELRGELEAAGHRFFSTSDTEVLLKSYRHWGPRCVERFAGMFAFAVHERDSGRVVLGRDRLGIKPLYYTEGHGRLRFASTLPALLAGGGVDTTVDPVALHHYLSFHSVVPPPLTILQGVRKLPPATLRTVEPDGTIRDEVFWRPVFERDPSRAGWSARDWEDATLEALRTAVRRRLVADVPVGVLLSGGLDSSLTVGLLAQEGQAGLKTFAIGFEAVGGEAGDEFEFSDRVAQRFDTDHTQVVVDTNQMLPALEDTVRAMGEPMVSHDTIAFYLLSQQVAQHVKVVQSGQGADEVFAGYHWYPPLADVPDGDVDAAVAAYRRAFFDRDHGDMAGLVQQQYLLDSDVSGDFVRQRFGAPGAATAVDRGLRMDTTVMLVDDPVKRVDMMTMAWGLEARVPFLDHDLVELAATIPPELKLAQDGKGVLKEIGRRIIPPEVIDRPKGYFPVPALKYLEGPYLERVRDALLAPEATERGLFRTDAVEHLLLKPNDELTRLRGNKLWQLGLLEMWLQSHGIR